MLKGISPLLGPDLLATLCRMGHGDELVLADAHFPGESTGPPVLRLDGVSIEPLLPVIEVTIEKHITYKRRFTAFYRCTEET